MSNKKIYFAASVRGGRKDDDLYKKIIGHLKKYGTVFTEDVGDSDILIKEAKQSAEAIYNKDIAWLMQSDVVVAEVSTPSLGVGVEIDRAAINKKNVLCLYRNNAPNKLSVMISGRKDLTVAYYDDILDAKMAIDFFFKML